MQPAGEMGWRRALLGSPERPRCPSGGRLCGRGGGTRENRKETSAAKSREFIGTCVKLEKRSGLIASRHLNRRSDGCHIGAMKNATRGGLRRELSFQ